MRPLVAFLVFAVAAAAGVLAVRAALSEAHRSAALDPAAWQRPVAPCTDSARERMVDDVVAHPLPHGLAVARVRPLLGPPDAVVGGELVYDVGTDVDGIGPPACLSLEIRTRKGRVLSARVVRDD